MKKSEFMEFISNVPKDDKVQYLLDNNDGNIEVLETTEFVQAYADEPSTIASYVKSSDLDLDCDYIRLGTYYDEAQEADSLEDLFTDEEVTDYFSELADTLDDDLDEFDGVLIELEA